MSASAVEAAAELSVRAVCADLRLASTWLAETARRYGVPAAQIAHLDICLNETLANLIAHGGAAVLSAPVHLRLAVRGKAGDGEASMTISDAGAAFDPLAVPPPPPQPRTLAQARPGGRGVALIRRFADSVSYRRGEERNHLTLGVRWNDAP